MHREEAVLLNLSLPVQSARTADLKRETLGSRKSAHALRITPQRPVYFCSRKRMLSQFSSSRKERSGTVGGREDRVRSGYPHPGHPTLNMSIKLARPGTKENSSPAQIKESWEREREHGRVEDATVMTRTEREKTVFIFRLQSFVQELFSPQTIYLFLID